MRSVFDVSADLMRIGGINQIQVIKLQKLAYYTFGWYGRLTGTPLFEQQFYAMPHGPVVGELLTLHRRKHKISRLLIEEAREEIADSYVKPDSYYEDVLHAVYDHYGQIDQWVLRDMTHEDDVWVDVWSRRPEGTRRAVMSHEEIIDFFIKRDIPDGLRNTLPDPQVEYLDEEMWEKLMSLPTHATPELVELFRGV